MNQDSGKKKNLKKAKNYEVIQALLGSNEPKGLPIKAWIKGVSIEEGARKQLLNVASLPFIYKWIAAMPDVHLGFGATIGSVIATRKAVIPAAVGVDLGCGMMAVQTTLKASDLPVDLRPLRFALEAAVPHGRTQGGGLNDRGAWSVLPKAVENSWAKMKPGYDAIVDKYPKLGKGNDVNHLGTLGGGNHFIEICLDEKDQVWFMLHSGSRGVGNRIGSHFIELAKEDMRRHFIHLPDQELAYLVEGTESFQDYFMAVEWAQNYAMENRKLMMDAVVGAVKSAKGIPSFEARVQAINCHHNYVARENHYNENVIVTRKGAVRARVEDFGIIPGSMGAKSYIVRGKENPESFHSCSHGAGRAMSRGEAKKRFSMEDHLRATAGIECRKDADVIDETPAAYKDIDQVMKAQSDLVDVVATLKQIVCVKG